MVEKLDPKQTVDPKNILKGEGLTWNWQSGEGSSVQIGYINKNGQRCCGHRGVSGTDHLQFSYKVECILCGYVYGANGTDMYERLCPECQGGKPGIPYWTMD
jgi:hypothetical protein